MYLFGYRLPGMSSLILWGLLWEVVGRADLTFFVPPLSEVLTTLFSIIGTPAFQKALAETAYAFFFGVFLDFCFSAFSYFTISKTELVGLGHILFLYFSGTTGHQFL